MHKGTILCLNASNSRVGDDGARRKTAKQQQCHESIEALCKRLANSPDAILLQEYNFKQTDKLAQFLPGGTAQWRVTRLFAEQTEAPVLAYNTDVYELLQMPLLDSLAGLERRGSLEAAGRYSAAVLQLKAAESSAAAVPQLLLVSYHGINNAKKDVKRKICKDFLSLVGAAVTKTGIPAIVGGDWNSVLLNHGKGSVSKLGVEAGFSVKLRPITAYVPEPAQCVRYHKKRIDYFCMVVPTAPDLVPSYPGIKEVYAVPHQQHRELYDHDPLLAVYELSASPPAVKTLTESRITLSRRISQILSKPRKGSNTPAGPPAMNRIKADRLSIGPDGGDGPSLADLQDAVARQAQQVQELEEKLTAAKSEQARLQELLVQASEDKEDATEKVQELKSDTHDSSRASTDVKEADVGLVKQSPIGLGGVPLNRLQVLTKDSMWYLVNKMNLDVKLDSDEDMLAHLLHTAGVQYSQMRTAELRSMCRLSVPKLNQKWRNAALIEQLQKQDRLRAEE